MYSDNQGPDGVQGALKARRNVISDDPGFLKVRWAEGCLRQALQAGLLGGGKGGSGLARGEPVETAALDCAWQEDACRGPGRRVSHVGPLGLCWCTSVPEFTRLAVQNDCLLRLSYSKKKKKEA